MQTAKPKAKLDESDGKFEQGFARLLLAAAIVTFLMIVIGAITRVSESGMGCGTDWPQCNGKIIPEFANAAVAIEYGHRLFALLVGGFALAAMVQAWRRYRTTPRVLFPVALALVLYFVQSGLGAVTVWLSNQWLSVLIHLANSMLLLACYLVAWVNVRATAAEDDLSADRLPFAEVLGATVLSYIVVLIGAMVAGNYATKACVGWPLCMGEVWPVRQGPLQLLNMIHRLTAGGLGIILLLLVIQSLRSRTSAMTRGALAAAFGLYILQAALGALVVLVDGREALTLLRSLHVTFAAATWSAMIVLSGVTWLQISYKNKSNNPLQSVTARSVTTSS